MTSEPAAAVPAEAGDERERPQAAEDARPVEEAGAVEDVLYRVFQARFLEDKVRELARAGQLSSDWEGLRVDVRTTVVASAMRPRSDGRGDACFPGPASPGPSLAFGATSLEFLRWAGRRGTSPAAARAGGASWTDLRRGLFGWSGGRGIMTQVLAGAALAFVRGSEDRAALVFEDRRALESGAWHEGASVATAARAPLVVVLVSSGAEPAAGGRSGQERSDLRDVARGHGVPVVELGAATCRELWRAAAEARSLAAAGRGPVLGELPAVPPGQSCCDRGHLASWAARAGLPDRRVQALERTARIDVEQAASRLEMEPDPRPLAALACVTADVAPLPPWTRREPPDPRDRQPLDAVELAPAGRGGASEDALYAGRAPI